MTDLNKLRSEFEQIHEIKEMFANNNELKWCIKSVRYVNHRVFQDAETGFINGAWFMFQEKAKAQAVPTWISVKDEEPPTDTMVLICWSDSPDVQPEIDYMTCDEDLNHIWANFYKDPPTHWMHFHKVPSESGAEG